MKAILKQEGEEKEVTQKIANYYYYYDFTNSWIGDVVLMTKLLKPPKHHGESLAVPRQKSESNRRPSDKWFVKLNYRGIFKLSLQENYSFSSPTPLMIVTSFIFFSAAESFRNTDEQGSQSN